MPAPDYLRAALFVDFDNVFSSLRERDPQAAESFAQFPLAWLTWFEAGRHGFPEPAGSIPEEGAPGEASSAAPVPRRVLLRRCYLNPAAFWRQRAGFVQAGFQVVDCPSLTYGGKNSADIQMALDIVEALGHETRFDEFLLLSGDADFAPVLLRLRLHDRRTTILASEQVAPALRASADVVVPIARFVSDALGLERGEALPPSEVELLAFVRETVLKAPRPLLLSQLGGQALRTFGEALREQRWFGAGSLSRLIETRLAPQVAVADRYAYAPERHEVPARAAATSGAGSEAIEGGRLAPDEATSAVIERVCEATGAPALSGETYDALFEAMAVALEDGARAQADVVHATRRLLAEAGLPASERDIGFVFYGFRLARLDLAALAGDVDALAEAFRENVRHRCRERGVVLNTGEEAAIDEWLLGVPDDPGGPDPVGEAASADPGAGEPQADDDGAEISEADDLDADGAASAGVAERAQPAAKTRAGGPRTKEATP